MITKNKIFATTLITTFLFTSIAPAFAATNKENLLSSITTLDTNYSTLKTNKTKDLETKLAALSKEYDDAIISLGYDAKTLNYLTALGKISGNTKNELIAEFIALKNEINSKVTSDVLALSALKDKIQYQYPTVTDAENTQLSADLKKISDNYTLAGTTFTTSLNNLEAKYKSNLATYKMTLKSSLDTNKTQVDTLRNFQNTYDALYTAKNGFEQNFVGFKDSYLSFAGELTTFSVETQKKYNTSLNAYLTGVIQKNLDANPGLAKHQLDMFRQKDILVENFSNALKDHVAKSYGVLYSDTDITSLETRFNTVKNRYFDLNGNIQATDVLSSSGAINEVIFLRDKYSELNTKVKSLLGNNPSQNTLSNLKIRLDNGMVEFYNNNYKAYGDDMLLKIKEKLDYVNLENKNILLAADSIDIRYNMFLDKLNKTKNLATIASLTSDFQKELDKYDYLNSTIIENKSKRLINNAHKYAIDTELANVKFKKFASRTASYEKQLKTVFTTLETKNPKTYITRLETLVAKLDVLLTKKLSDKNRHQVLVIKKIVIEYLNTQYK